MLGTMSVFFRIILWPFVKIIAFTWWILKKCLSVLLATFLGTSMIAFVALIFPNTWLPVYIEKHIENKTGFSMQIEESKCNLFKGHFEFHNALMINPANRYPVDHALSIETFTMDIQPKSLWKDFWSQEEFIISNIYLDIDDITVIRNSQGKINFVEWFEGLGCRENNTTNSNLSPSETENTDTFSYVSKKSQTKNNSDSRKWHIEQLTFRLDSLRWKDFKPEKPQEKSFELFYRHQWTQVSSFHEITDTILTDFKSYGISFFLQSILHSFLNLPGISNAHGGIQALQSLSKRILSGVSGEIQSLFTKTTTKSQ
jgi:hypothetical protein